jgi:transcriptional regulator with XRE-family HTH domain
MENPYQMLGKKVRFYREKAGLTQAELAEKSGLSDNFIGLIERGIKHPKLTTLTKISAVLGVQLHELFHPLNTGEEENKIALKELKELLNKKSFKDAKLLLSIYRTIRDYYTTD